MSTLAAMSKCQCGNDQQSRLSTLTYDRRLTGNVRAHCQERTGRFQGHEPRIHCVREKQTVSGTMTKEAKEFFEYDSAGCWERAGALPAACRNRSRARA